MSFMHETYTPLRYTPMSFISKMYVLVSFMPKTYTPTKYTPRSFMRRNTEYMPIKCTLINFTPKRYRVHAREMPTCEMPADELHA